MEKHTASLVSLPGCKGCGHTCKYNGSIADPVAASNYDVEKPYGCNSKLVNLELGESKGNDI